MIHIGLSLCCFFLIFPLHATKLERAVLRTESEHCSLDFGPQGIGDYNVFSLPEISSLPVTKTSRDSWRTSPNRQKPADILGTSGEIAAKPSPLTGQEPITFREPWVRPPAPWNHLQQPFPRLLPHTCTLKTHPLLFLAAVRT